MTRVRVGAVTAIFVLAAALTLFLVLVAGRSTGPAAAVVPKSGSEESVEAKAGLGPTSYEAFLSAMRTYPAKSISPTIVARAKTTFGRIARVDARRLKHGRRFQWDSNTWKLYGPRVNGTEPGVISFSGATNNTASRTPALVADPDCTAHKCRLWAGVSGGGVWMTENAVVPNPVWKQISPEDLDQNSVGTLVLVPGSKKHEHGKKHGQWSDDNQKDTLYLGTGEANRCSSGCEAGVGIYKSTDDGQHWKKLADKCVSNGTYSCVNPGKDAFLGRAIGSIVIDPKNSKHMLVGSAQAVRGLSHVIGAGGTSRNEPGANEPGLYESWDGGNTFTEVWDGAKPDAGQSFGVTDVGLDPLSPGTVYVAAFDAGVWRRDAGASATSFNQVFAPQFNQGIGTDRAMFALTVKNLHTRIYLTEGTSASSSIADPLAANFWRLDNANQPAATLLGTQAPCASPNPATSTFPTTYNGWQCLTSKTTGDPYFATDAFCTGQCWYDQDVYTPEGMPDTVYVIGSFSYGELPCDTKGVGCGNGRSNGRGVLYSDTAGDPDGTRTDLRTFTDMTYDAQDNPAPWCAFAPYFDQGCLHAPDSIHPDQHEIVINPGNPTQFFEGSDGGMVRTSGAFADVSAQCDSPYRNGGTPLPPTSGSYTACKRLLSRAPVQIEHIDRKLSSTLQFIGVAINPSLSCEVMAGTQDNGTWSNLDNCDRNTWPQIIYGDGGNAGYDATQPTWRFNEFTSGFSDSNFANGDPEKWVITSAPVVNSVESPSNIGFYWPQISDPNPLPGTHPIYSGARDVWRTWAFGAGTPGAVPQDTTPNIAGYEANCPEFVVSGANPACGDYQPLGGPYCDGIASTTTPSCINQPGDLAGTTYGTDRTGLAISWIARDAADHGTIWAATGSGRVFVTHNADATDPSTVTWHRIDSSTSGSSPTRYPSGIYVDPKHSDHAWIVYSGYNAVTPSTPGHAFSVWENGSAPGSGSFTNLNVESGASAYPTPFSDGDLPVSDIVRDDATHTLYVGTDFGVLRGSNDGASWHVTKGMPRYEIMHLEIQPSNRVPVCMGHGHCKRILYASTHSQGIWKMNLNH